MNRTVLIVDDDVEIRSALHRIFKRMDWQTADARDGAEALQKVRHKRFDLITMDMAMATMDGLDAISVLRNETDVPIVVISGNLTEDVKSDLRVRNVRHFLEKPFGVGHVVEAANRALHEG